LVPTAFSHCATHELLYFLPLPSHTGLYIAGQMHGSASSRLAGVFTAARFKTEALHGENLVTFAHFASHRLEYVLFFYALKMVNVINSIKFKFDVLSRIIANWFVNSWARAVTSADTCRHESNNC